MKPFFFSALLLFGSVAAVEAKPAGPGYRIPENASSGPETCVTTELVSVPEGNCWSEPRPELRSESHRSYYWMDGYDFYSLVRADDGRRVVHTRTTEEVIDGSLTQRVRHVTEWTKAQEWRKESYEVSEAITRLPGAPVRILETRGGLSLAWDVTTRGEGTVQVTERLLRNPTALNRADRRLSHHAEVCRYRLP